MWSACVLYICRYISVCHPFRREKFCTVRRACIVVACLTLCVVALNLVQAYFWHYTGAICDIRPSVGQHVWSVWSWTSELLVFLLVPLAILVLNILVISATQRVTENMRTLLRSARRSCGLLNCTFSLSLSLSLSPSLSTVTCLYQQSGGASGQTSLAPENSCTLQTCWISEPWNAERDRYSTASSSECYRYEMISIS